jgi:hypothetical protein
MNSHTPQCGSAYVLADASFQVSIITKNGAKGATKLRTETTPHRSIKSLRKMYKKYIFATSIEAAKKGNFCGSNQPNKAY